MAAKAMKAVTNSPSVRLGMFQGSSAWHWIGAINKQAMARIGSTKQTYITLCMAPYWLPIYM